MAEKSPFESVGWKSNGKLLTFQVIPVKEEII